jgi:ferredoxin
MSETLKVDMIACDGHGVCAELVPELIGLDEWGYPIVSATPVPPDARKHAKRAVALCPRLALSLAQGESPARAEVKPGRRRR